MSKISREELMGLLEYDPETGNFHSLESRRVVGWYDHGYVRISVRREKHYAHRLAWLYSYGHMPELIDHVDGDGLNNILANLREATDSQSMANRRKNKNNQCGYRGVRFKGSHGKYEARIGVNRNHLFLGYFDTAEEAHATYVDAARKFFGEFANPG